MKSIIINEAAHYYGTQYEIAAKIARMLYTRDDKKTVSIILDFIRIQRAFGHDFIAWRGIGIDTRPRHCSCWLEDESAFLRWLQNCSEA